MVNRAQLITDIFQNMGAMRRLMLGHQPEANKGNAPTHAQMGVLFALIHNSNFGVKDLAKCFGMTPSAGTQLINGLVKRGWVTRKISAQDRRKHSLHVSPLGRRQLKKIIAQRSALMAKRLQVLSDQELKQLKFIQEKLIASDR